MVRVGRLPDKMALHCFNIDKPRWAHYYNFDRFNYRLPVYLFDCKGTGSSIDVRIPIFGTRFNPIFWHLDVNLQPFPELTPETVQKQKKGE